MAWNFSSTSHGRASVIGWDIVMLSVEPKVNLHGEDMLTPQQITWLKQCSEKDITLLLQSVEHRLHTGSSRLAKAFKNVCISEKSGFIVTSKLSKALVLSVSFRKQRSLCIQRLLSACALFKWDGLLCSQRSVYIRFSLGIKAYCLNHKLIACVLKDKYYSEFQWFI